MHIMKVKVKVSGLKCSEVWENNLNNINVKCTEFDALNSNFNY